VFFFMTGLERKGHHMTQIKSHQNNNDMQHPPAWPIPHEIFQHIISRAYGPLSRLWICQRNVLSTIQALKNLFSSKNFPSPFPCTAPSKGIKMLKLSTFSLSTCSVTLFVTYPHITTFIPNVNLSFAKDLIITLAIVSCPLLP